MIEIDDLEDHQKSEAHERALAEASSIPSVQKMHLALAEVYAKRVAQVKIEEAEQGRT
jgi:hypothetical protein